jgi:hypothetical protein
MEFCRDLGVQYVIFEGDFAQVVKAISLNDFLWCRCGRNKRHAKRFPKLGCETHEAGGWPNKWCGTNWIKFGRRRSQVLLFML